MTHDDDFRYEYLSEVGTLFENKNIEKLFRCSHVQSSYLYSVSVYLAILLSLCLLPTIFLPVYLAILLSLYISATIS